MIKIGKDGVSHLRGKDRVSPFRGKDGVSPFRGKDGVSHLRGKDGLSYSDTNIQIGTTLACFQYTEILPLSIDSWKTNDKNGDSSFDKLFKK
jgi:hypothetical protein